MPIPVACPCGAKFAAQDKLAGKRVKCPKCGEPLAIPPAAESPASEAPASTKPASKPATAAKTNPTKQSASSTPATASPVASIFDEIGLQKVVQGPKCPKCGAGMREDAILCIQCGFNTKAGKQIETVSDSKAIAKREEIYEKQREAAEKLAKSRGYGAGGSKGGGSTYGEKTGLSWVREQGSFGEVWSTTKQIINSPSTVFQDLPPTGGTGLALMYPVMTQLWVAVIWFFIQCAILGIAAISKPDVAAHLPLEIGLRVAGIGISFVLNLIFLPLYGVLIAGLAHLIMMAGDTKLGFGATFRVVMYTMGACIGISVIPCVALAVPIVWPIILALALAGHHRVGTGIGFGGSFLGLIVATPVFVVIVVFVYLAVIFAIVAAILATQGPPVASLFF